MGRNKIFAKSVTLWNLQADFTILILLLIHLECHFSLSSVRIFSPSNSKSFTKKKQRTLFVRYFQNKATHKIRVKSIGRNIVRPQFQNENFSVFKCPISPVYKPAFMRDTLLFWTFNQKSESSLSFILNDVDIIRINTK